MKNIVIIAVVVIALILGWLFYNSSGNEYVANDINATSTATNNNSGGSTQNPNSEVNAGAPVALTSTTVVSSDTTAIVKGAVTPNGAFTNYWYEYGTTASLGSKIAGQSLGSGYASVSAPAYITGLTKDTTYYFSLVAENTYGETRGKTYSFETTHGITPPVGSAPKATTLGASSISKSTANLNGQVNPNKTETEYWFEYGPTANLGNTTALVSAGEGSALVKTGISLSGLASSTTYYFRLNAQNQFGTVNGSILNFKTK